MKNALKSSLDGVKARGRQLLGLLYFYYLLELICSQRENK